MNGKEILYQDELFNISFDYALPIAGLVTITPSRNVKSYENLTVPETMEMSELINKTISFLQRHITCEGYSVTFDKSRFRVIIMPIYDWIKEKFENRPLDLYGLHEYISSYVNIEEAYKKMRLLSIMIKDDFEKEEKNYPKR